MEATEKPEPAGIDGNSMRSKLKAIKALNPRQHRYTEQNDGDWSARVNQNSPDEPHQEV